MTKKELREFGILIGLGFPIVIGFIIPSIVGHAFRAWTVYLGLPFLILGFIKPKFLFYPYKVWMKLGFILGWVNSRIILGLVFLIILQPIAFLMKAFGYDPLKNKKGKKNSYRENKSQKSIDLTRIF